MRVAIDFKTTTREAGNLPFGSFGSHMRPFHLLFLGDIVGQNGLREVIRQLPHLKEQFEADCVIVNGENIVNGKGLTEAESEELFAAGVHCITTGNHVWENWKARPLLQKDPRVLRPLNYPAENPGRGAGV